MSRSLLLTVVTVLVAVFVSVPLANAEEPVQPAAVLEQVDSPSHEIGDALADVDGDVTTVADDAARDVSTAKVTAARAVGATMSIHLSRSHVVFGDRVAITGAFTAAPGAPGGAGPVNVIVERAVSAGVWTPLATTALDAGEQYATDWVARENVVLRARADDDSAVSSAVALHVTPKLVIGRVPTAPALVGARLRARVFPATYRGRVSFAVRYQGRVRGMVATQPRRGVIDVVVPTNGIGRLPVTVRLGAHAGLSGAVAHTSVRSTVRTLRVGSRGADVRAMLVRMRYLHFLTPGATTTYDARVGDVTLAFHKWQRMNRTTVVDRATWHRLLTVAPMRPRFVTPATHIEVDKTRQILSVVRRGTVVGTIHVSTGATGNTPVGRFRIYQRGGSYLYRFMAFIGNYGIHGYVPVPAYPASHGCVREPMWTASWTWKQSTYGTPVIIYR